MKLSACNVDGSTAGGDTKADFPVEKGVNNGEFEIGRYNSSAAKRGVSSTSRRPVRLLGRS